MNTEKYGYRERARERERERERGRGMRVFERYTYIAIREI